MFQDLDIEHDRCQFGGCRWFWNQGPITSLTKFITKQLFLYSVDKGQRGKAELIGRGQIFISSQTLNLAQLWQWFFLLFNNKSIFYLYGALKFIQSLHVYHLADIWLTICFSTGSADMILLMNEEMNVSKVVSGHIIQERKKLIFILTIS